MLEGWSVLPAAIVQVWLAPLIFLWHSIPYSLTIINDYPKMLPLFCGNQWTKDSSIYSKTCYLLLSPASSPSRPAFLTKWGSNLIFKWALPFLDITWVDKVNCDFSWNHYDWEYNIYRIPAWEFSGVACVLMVPPYFTNLLASHSKKQRNSFHFSWWVLSKCVVDRWTDGEIPQSSRMYSVLNHQRRNPVVPLFLNISSARSVSVSGPIQYTTYETAGIRQHCAIWESLK